MLNSQNWLVKKEDQIGSPYIKIWIYKDMAGGISVLHFTSSGEPYEETIKSSGGDGEVTPTMVIPVFGWNSLIE